MNETAGTKLDGNPQSAWFLREILEGIPSVAASLVADLAKILTANPVGTFAVFVAGTASAMIFPEGLQLAIVAVMQLSITSMACVIVLCEHRTKWALRMAFLVTVYYFGWELMRDPWYPLVPIQNG